jgi:hypothetical protein
VVEVKLHVQQKTTNISKTISKSRQTNGQTNWKTIHEFLSTQSLVAIETSIKVYRLALLPCRDTLCMYMHALHSPLSVAVNNGQFDAPENTFNPNKQSVRREGHKVASLEARSDPLLLSLR